MTPAAKVVYLSALLLGLIPGTIWGFANAMNRIRVADELKWIISATEVERVAVIQLRHAEAQHARNSLESATSLLEDMERLRPNKAQRRMLTSVYTRLALLEDAAGNSEKSRAAMTKAKYWYMTSGGKEMTDAEMKTAIKQFDDAMAAANE